jgi:hypothetical protein
MSCGFGTELVDTVESVVDPKALEVLVLYLPYQELETSDGFPCTISLVDLVDYARAHDKDSVYGLRFSSLSRSISGYIPIMASIPISGRVNSVSTYV